MSKTALIRVTCEVLPQVLGPLSDHGLSVIGSAHGVFCGEVALLIEGHPLPQECELPGQEVSLQFTKETYGSQSIVRVSEIRLIQKTALAA